MSSVILRWVCEPEKVSILSEFWCLKQPRGGKKNPATHSFLTRLSNKNTPTDATAVEQIPCGLICILHLTIDRIENEKRGAGRKAELHCWLATLTANQRSTAEWFSRPSGSFAPPSLKATKQMKNGPQHRKAYDYNLCADRWHGLRWCLQFCSHQEEERAQWQLDIALRL